ncbi:MAG: hypothetical protein OXG44_01610 [Gammaproteobacteria bacterium]|nr:hypothetical protein [Gammaproteobacteria bacterium]
MKRLIVHIGPRKTGSTSIQRMLVSLAPALRAEGVHVHLPGVVPSRHRAHLGLAGEAARATSPEWTRLAGEVRAAGRDRIVVSEEDFASPRHRDLAALRLAELAAREGLDVRIIAYVRPQWQILEAEYSQRACSHRVAEPFPAFVDDMLRAGEDTILDYNRVFAPYRERFGARVRVFPLERAALPDGLARHFLAEVGASADLLDRAGGARHNVRRGAKEVEVRRMLRARLPRCLPLPRTLLPELRTVIGDDAPFAGCDARQIRALNARFAAANTRLATDYAVHADGVLFQDPEAGLSKGPRPNVTCWERFEPDVRLRVRCYVLRELGLDLDGGLWSASLCVARRAARTLLMRTRTAIST